MVVHSSRQHTYQVHGRRTNKDAVPDAGQAQRMPCAMRVPTGAPTTISWSMDLSGAARQGEVKVLPGSLSSIRDATPRQLAIVATGLSAA